MSDYEEILAHRIILEAESLKNDNAVYCTRFLGTTDYEVREQVSKVGGEAMEAALEVWEDALESAFFSLPPCRCCRDLRDEDEADPWAWTSERQDEMASYYADKEDATAYWASEPVDYYEYL